MGQAALVEEQAAAVGERWAARRQAVRWAAALLPQAAQCREQAAVQLHRVTRLLQVVRCQEQAATRPLRGPRPTAVRAPGVGAGILIMTAPALQLLALP